MGALSQVAQARPTPSEKAAARSAFWGLFASNYLALLCIDSLTEPQSCLETRIKQATDHASAVRKAVGAGELAFTPSLEAAKNSLQSGDLLTVESFLVELESRLIEQFASTAAPAITPSLSIGRDKYAEYCQACSAISTEAV